jgi:hypothetical protein
VALSGVPGRGGKARIDKLIEEYAGHIGLRDWRIWDAAQITCLLNAYPQVRRAFAALITSSEVLAQMRDRFDSPPEVSVVLNIPETAIRPGQPGSEAAFTAAYQAAGGRPRLGQALGEVYETGAGYVQHFDGGPAGEAAVLCALGGRPALAIAQSLWDELSAVGYPDRGGGITGVGFPVGSQPPGVFIDRDSKEIELAGGQWGPGRLIRGTLEQWVWRPDIAFDSLATSDRTAWSLNDGDMDVRFRLAARIRVGGTDMRVTASGRRRMLEALHQSSLNDVILAAARRRGLPADAVAWEETPDPAGHNNTRFATYQAVIPAASDLPALLANVWFMLPGTYTDALSSAADLRVDFAAMRNGGHGDSESDLRLTVGELTDYFVQAWIVATAILPLAAGVNPLEAPPTGTSRLEIYIQNERPEASGKPRALRTVDLVDLSAYGQPRNTPLTDLSVGIKFPLGLAESEIKELVQRGLTRMAEDFGFNEI